jgi:transposase-like protein
MLILECRWLIRLTPKLGWRKMGVRRIRALAMDVFDHASLAFPQSLPEFQRLFPDDAACAAYLEKARWEGNFVCPHCQAGGEPFRFDNRPGVLRCRKCCRNTGLMVGTVMERSHTPLSVWFWAAYLVASQTPGISAVQFQRQLRLSRYETAFQILHKLRAGMVRPDQDRIGGHPGTHIEVDEAWIGGRTRGEGRGVHHKTLVAVAVEVRYRQPGTAQDKRKDGRYAGRVRLAIAADRSAESLCGFVESAVTPGSLIVTDDWSGYNSLRTRGYDHHAIAECGDPEVSEDFLPISHLVICNLKTWLNGTHHGVSAKHLQAYLNEFTFRFNRRLYPFNAFRSLLGIAGVTTAPTYTELYSDEWQHTKCSGYGH